MSTHKAIVSWERGDQPKVPSREELDHMHHEAHDECFIAHSVKSEVRCEPMYGA